jgi:hypothetical protein
LLTFMVDNFDITSLIFDFLVLTSSVASLSSPQTLGAFRYSSKFTPRTYRSLMQLRVNFFQAMIIFLSIVLFRNLSAEDVPASHCSGDNNMNT